MVQSAIGFTLLAEPLPERPLAESILLIPGASGLEPAWNHEAMPPC